MKRFGLRLLMVCSLLLGLLLAVPALAGALKDEVIVYLEAPGWINVSPALLVDSKTLVPVEWFALSLGGTVKYAPEKKAVCLSVPAPVSDDPKFTCQLPEKVQVTGSFGGLSAVPLILNGKELPGEPPALQDVAGQGVTRTFIPLRAVAEALGLTVTWDPEQRSVVVLPASVTTLSCAVRKDLATSLKAGEELATECLQRTYLKSK